MNIEDIAGHQGNLVKEFMSACEESTEALAFSWRTVQQMETRDAQDWTQVNVNACDVVEALHSIDARGDCSCQRDLRHDTKPAADESLDVRSLNIHHVSDDATTTK